MEARNLTAKFVENVPAPKAGRVVYPDTGLRGLVLRVRFTGTKSWAVIKRVKKGQGTGRQRLVTIGTYPAFSLEQARDAARDIIRDMARGIDPVETREAERTKAEAETATLH